MQARMLACPNFINGEWTTGAEGKSEVRSPAHCQVIGEITRPSRAQIDSAIEAASQAQLEWAKLPIKERSKVLFNFRNILLREADAISRLKSSESGKNF